MYIRQKKQEEKVKIKEKFLLLIAVAVCASMPLHAQYRIVENLPKYDRQKIHFGFAIGSNITDFKLVKVGNFNTFDSLYVLDNIKQTGFNLNIISNLHLGNHFDFRFIPGLSFAQRDLNYTFYGFDSTTKLINKQVESTFLQVPFYLKFKSQRVNNYRAFVQGGFEFNVDMVSQAKVKNKDKEFVKLGRRDYGYSVGMGFDFYMEMFKFGMDIRMYQGLNNLKVVDSTIYARSISSLRSRIFTLTLTFE